MERLARLLNGTAWDWTISAGFARGSMPISIGFDYGGFTPRQFGLLLEASQDSMYPMPEAPGMMDDLARTTHVTRRRSEWVGDDAFYAHPQWELYRQPAGSDHYIFSLCSFADGFVVGLGIHRAPGLPDFTPRQTRLVHTVMSALRLLRGAGLPRFTTERSLALTPRLRVVLMLMLKGWNRGRIAEHLGVTPTTVAGYQKHIYHHFGVGSQPELLAGFIRGATQERPDTTLDGEGNSR